MKTETNKSLSALMVDIAKLTKKHGLPEGRFLTPDGSHIIANTEGTFLLRATERWTTLKR